MRLRGTSLSLEYGIRHYKKSSSIRLLLVTLVFTIILKMSVLFIICTSEIRMFAFTGTRQAKNLVNFFYQAEFLQ